MEALAALGVAASAVQFATFASNLISNAVEIHGSAKGAAEHVLSMETIYGQLSGLASALAAASASEYLPPVNNKAVPPSGEESNKSTTTAAIQVLSHQCRDDCHQLLSIVAKLKSQDATGSRRRWDSFRLALRTLWSKKDIQDLESRLSKTQTSLTLSVVKLTADWQVYHREQLERMQKESLRLQSNHHARLKGIEKHLLQIKKDVFVLQKPIDGGTWTRIDALQKQMATVVDSNNEVSRQHAILQSLTFPARPVRHDSLSEAHSKTYQWMFAETSTEAPDSAEGSFLRWLRQGSGIFWFSGKAGSGKSTLVKFVADDRRTLAALRRWARPAEVVIASHYFWAAGSAIQRSQQGLLQTLLFDIFRQVPGLAKLTCPDRWSDCLGSLSPAWSLAELHNTLRQVARVTLDSDVAGADATSVKFCIFIDGADEYEGDQLELCDAIKELSQFPCFKLCISSRPWNVFEDAFGANEAQKINLHELTNQDIRQYAESRLQQHPRWARVASSAMAADCQELLDQITERSSGVFLWVVLVTNLLREGLTNDDSLSDLRRRLESFPVELEPFFKSMLDSVERFYYEKMATTFRMATHAKGPLHWMMYAFHDMEYEDSDYSLNLPPESFAEGDVKEMEAQTARRLNGRSRGLLEIDVKGDVNVLHRTVMDFLRTQEIADFLVENSPPWFVPERSVLKAHAALLKVQDWRYPRSVSRRDPIPTAAASQCLVFSRLNLANFINISGLCVIILGIAFWMS